VDPEGMLYLEQENVLVKACFFKMASGSGF
jgi:hypothetical protein